MNRVFGGLVALTLLTPVAHADESVTLYEGQTRVSKFRTQVQKVKVDSSDPRVASVRYRDGYGVEIRGNRAGQSEITVSGETVSYSAGTNQPLAKYTPFRNVYRVTVNPAPTPRPTPTPAPPREERMRVVLRVGETKQQRSWQQARNVQFRAREGRENIRVSFTRAKGIEITGVRPGSTVFQARGDRPQTIGGRTRWETVIYTYEVTVTE